MRKWREIKDEPITWGSYASFAGRWTLIVLAFYAVCAGIAVVWYYAEEISDWFADCFDKLKSKFKKK